MIYSLVKLLKVWLNFKNIVIKFIFIDNKDIYIGIWEVVVYLRVEYNILMIGMKFIYSLMRGVIKIEIFGL